MDVVTRKSAVLVSETVVALGGSAAVVHFVVQLHEVHSQLVALGFERVTINNLRFA